MSFDDLKLISQIRRVRENAAEQRFQIAKARAEEAEKAARQAEETLAQFDGHLDQRLRDFHDATGKPISSLEGAQSFHSNLMREREGYARQIAMARIEVRRALEAAERARHEWATAHAKTETTQTAAQEARLGVRRDSERRQEQDLDELATGRAGKAGSRGLGG